MKKSFMSASLAAVFCVAAGAAPQQQSSQQPQAKVNVGTAASAKAKSPTPSPTAKNKTQSASIGKGRLTAKTAQPSSFWTEEIDLEGSGNLVSTDFLYDSTRGILYAYRSDDFTCANGEPGRGAILEAVYAKGNPARKPVGSGWYTVGLNQGKCGAKQAGEYGCRFDANGNPTECGVATINYATGNIDIAVAQ